MKPSMGDLGDLRRGVRGAGGTRIRFRRPTDDPGLLLDLYRQAVGDEMPLDHPLLAGETSAALIAGAQGGPAMIRQRLTGRTLFEMYEDYCAVIVAESGQDVVGGIFLAPPLQLLDELASPTAARVVTAVVKLSALAVRRSHRGLGIGASLVKQARAAYLPCNTALIYGEFDGQDEALGRFYSGRGFELLDRDDVIDLSPIVGTPFYIREGEGMDRLFVRPISPAYTFPIRRSSGVLPDSHDN